MRRPLYLALGGGLLIAHAAVAQAPAQPKAQAPAARPTRTEAGLLDALAADQVTAPFQFTTTLRNGRVVLGGRVATKEVHDRAVRIAIALGIAVDDRLVIDTATAYVPAIAGPQPAVASQAPGVVGRVNAPWALPAAFTPCVYPPPLFGYYDEPFYGFEPPLLTYPPWWRNMSARRVDPTGSGNPQPLGAAQAGTSDGTVEMTIDPNGYAVLRGTVPTLADRVNVGQQLAQQPGVTGVLNLLEVRNPAATPAPARGTPPPPPRPAEDLPGPAPARVAPPGPPAPAAEPIPGAIPVDGADLAARLRGALARRPALKDLGVRTSVRDGIATVAGRVPTVLEAMQAFRAAQQTPGVRAVDDRLEFKVPEEGERNPLIERGRPEDVEPYLQGQVSRQLGDQAHVDRVRVRGDLLEVKGTVAVPADRPRVEAILRSMPLLRGFRVEPDFVSD
jgi:osmotically-inducible protein OsmY